MKSAYKIFAFFGHGMTAASIATNYALKSVEIFWLVLAAAAIGYVIVMPTIKELESK